MIQLDKTGSESNDSKQRRDEFCSDRKQAFDALTDDQKHDPAVVRKEIISKITSSQYASSDDKQALYKTSHFKCAWCEIRSDKDPEDLEKNEDEEDSEDLGPTFHVDHYAPKSKYWWLAYDWHNLIPLCANCNGKGHKGDDFERDGLAVLAYPAPIETVHQQARFINPYIENPEDIFYITMTIESGNIAFIVTPRSHTIYQDEYSEKTRCTFNTKGTNRLRLHSIWKRLHKDLMSESGLLHRLELAFCRDSVEEIILLYQEMIEKCNSMAEYSRIHRVIFYYHLFESSHSAVHQQKTQFYQRLLAFHHMYTNIQSMPRRPNARDAFGGIDARSAFSQPLHAFAQKWIATQAQLPHLSTLERNLFDHVRSMHDAAYQSPSIFNEIGGAQAG